jgi:hypothetical protein
MGVDFLELNLEQLVGNFHDWAVGLAHRRQVRRGEISVFRTFASLSGSDFRRRFS